MCVWGGGGGGNIKVQNNLFIFGQTLVDNAFLKFGLTLIRFA